MRRSLRVSRSAERQIRKAADWWLENRRAARGLFHRELSRAFDMITAQPEAAPEIDDPELPGVRRLLLSRIHYHLYYREIDDQSVEVLAIWHTSREPWP